MLYTAVLHTWEEGQQRERETEQCENSTFAALGMSKTFFPARHLHAKGCLKLWKAKKKVH